MASFLDLIGSSLNFIIGVVVLFICVFIFFCFIFWLYYKYKSKSIKKNIPVNFEDKIKQENKRIKEVENVREKEEKKAREGRRRRSGREPVREETRGGSETIEGTDRNIESEGTSLQKPTTAKTYRSVPKLSSKSNTKFKRAVKLHKPKPL